MFRARNVSQKREREMEKRRNQGDLAYLVPISRSPVTITVDERTMTILRSSSTQPRGDFNARSEIILMRDVRLKRLHWLASVNATLIERCNATYDQINLHLSFHLARPFVVMKSIFPSDTIDVCFNN